MKTEPIRAPDERVHLAPDKILLQDQIIGYLAFRRANDSTDADASRDMGMSKNWANDVVRSDIKTITYPTRKKVTEALRARYGEAGIPIMHPASIVAARAPAAAVRNGFGPKSGDPNRTLAPLHEAPPRLDPVEPPDDEVGGEIEASIGSLVEEATPEELAGLYLQAKDRVESLEADLKQKQGELDASALRIMALANNITGMDNVRQRLVAEIAERDMTLEGQAEDLVQYEKSMDIQARAIEDLQGFKDGTMAMLRQFAVLMYQVVPPPIEAPKHRVYVTLGNSEVDVTGLKEGEIEALREALEERVTIRAGQREWPRDALDMG